MKTTPSHPGKHREPVPFTLIGEEISGAWNTQALTDIALAFGGDYLPYGDTRGEVAETSGAATEQTCPDSAEINDVQSMSAIDVSPLEAFAWLLAAENRPDAQNLYACRPPNPIPPSVYNGENRVAGRYAVLVGNEAKGVRRRTLRRAHAVAEIPLVSKNINCLNVAAAAAIMLYYLEVNSVLKTPLGQKKRTLAAVQKSRPDILLIGGRDPMELGSTIRSACAFGWERVFLEDRGNAWYACDRLMKSEGRGAARRGRNPIKVIPSSHDLLRHYDRIVVVTHRQTGPPLYTVPITARAEERVLIVLPDEHGLLEGDLLQGWPAGSVLADHEAYEASVCYAGLPSMAAERYHYRQSASIALAEAARQLGQPEGEGIYLQGRKQRYRKAVVEETAGICLTLDDLGLF